MLFKLVLASLWSRRVMAILTCTSIAISMLVLIGVEHLRLEVKSNFERTVSGVDLIVGSRTSGINLYYFQCSKLEIQAITLNGKDTKILSIINKSRGQCRFQWGILIKVFQL